MSSFVYRKSQPQWWAVLCVASSRQCACSGVSSIKLQSWLLHHWRKHNNSLCCLQVTFSRGLISTRWKDRSCFLSPLNLNYCSNIFHQDGTSLNNHLTTLQKDFSAGMQVMLLGCDAADHFIDFTFKTHNILFLLVTLWRELKLQQGKADYTLINQF